MRPLTICASSNQHSLDPDVRTNLGYTVLTTLHNTFALGQKFGGSSSRMMRQVIVAGKKSSISSVCHQYKPVKCLIWAGSGMMAHGSVCLLRLAKISSGPIVPWTGRQVLASSKKSQFRLHNFVARSVDRRDVAIDCISLSLVMHVRHHVTTTLSVAATGSFFRWTKASNNTSQQPSSNGHRINTARFCHINPRDRSTNRTVAMGFSTRPARSPQLRKSEDRTNL
jgi:hypothetical protein